MKNYLSVEEETEMLIDKLSKNQNSFNNQNNYSSSLNQHNNNVVSGKASTLYSFLPNNKQIAYSRNQQFNNLEAQMKIESLHKQYQLKIQNIQEYFQLKEYKYKEQINRLSIELQIMQNKQKDSPRKRLEKDSRISENIKNNSNVYNEQVSKHLKKMLQEVQQSHKFCIAQKKNHIQTISILQAKLKILEQDAEKMMQQNERLSKQIRNMLSTQRGYEVDKKNWQIRQKQRQKKQIQKQNQLAFQFQEQRQMRKDAQATRLQFQKLKRIQIAKIQQRGKYQSYQIGQKSRQSYRLTSNKSPKLDKSIGQANQQSIVINSKNALQILKKELQQQLKSSFPQSNDQLKQRKAKDIMSKLLTNKNNFEINPGKKYNSQQNSLSLNKISEGNNELNRKQNILQDYKNNNYSTNALNQIIQKRKNIIERPSHSGFKYLPNNKNKENENIDTFRKVQIYGEKQNSYSFMFH